MLRLHLSFGSRKERLNESKATNAICQLWTWLEIKFWIVYVMRFVESAPSAPSRRDEFISSLKRIRRPPPSPSNLKWTCYKCAPSTVLSANINDIFQASPKKIRLDFIQLVVVVFLRRKINKILPLLFPAWRLFTDLLLPVICLILLLFYVVRDIPQSEHFFRVCPTLLLLQYLVFSRVRNKVEIRSACFTWFNFTNKMESDFSFVPTSILKLYNRIFSFIPNIGHMCHVCSRFFLWKRWIYDEAFGGVSQHLHPS